MLCTITTSWATTLKRSWILFSRARWASTLQLPTTDHLSHVADLCQYRNGLRVSLLFACIITQITPDRQCAVQSLQYCTFTRALPVLPPLTFPDQSFTSCAAEKVGYNSKSTVASTRSNCPKPNCEQLSANSHSCRHLSLFSVRSAVQEITSRLATQQHL